MGNFICSFRMRTSIKIQAIHEKTLELYLSNKLIRCMKMSRHMTGLCQDSIEMSPYEDQHPSVRKLQ